MIAIVALVIVGPHKLPGVARTVGQWIRKLRLFTTEMRAQTGIDEILREEGIEGGPVELLPLGLLGGVLGLQLVAQGHELVYLGDDAVLFGPGRNSY